MGKKSAAIVIRTKSTKEQAFLVGLLERLGVSGHMLSEEELMDLGMGKLMRQVDRTKRVDGRTAMKILAT
ncbi:MAG: hypothetical protein ACO1NQ_01210 [Flavobacteriales bacterium]